MVEYVWREYWFFFPCYFHLCYQMLFFVFLVQAGGRNSSTDSRRFFINSYFQVSFVVSEPDKNLNLSPMGWGFGFWCFFLIVPGNQMITQPPVSPLLRPERPKLFPWSSFLSPGGCLRVTESVNARLPYLQWEFSYFPTKSSLCLSVCLSAALG